MFIQSPDVLTLGSRHTDKVQFSINLFPRSLSSESVEDLTLGVDSPNVISIVTANTNVLELLFWNMFKSSLYSMYNEDIVVGIDTPDLLTISSSTGDLTELCRFLNF